MSEEECQPTEAKGELMGRGHAQDANDEEQDGTILQLVASEQPATDRDIVGLRSVRDETGEVQQAEKGG